MFKILNNSTAVKDFQVTKEVAKVSAREILREKSGAAMAASSASYVSTADFTNKWWSSRIDVKEAIKNSRQYQKDYERTLPEKLSSQAQSEMWKKAKRLKDEFMQGMLSRDELHPVKAFEMGGTVKYVVDEERMRALRSTEREIAWQKKNEAKIKEFKNLMRHLNPDDPNAGDIERFRPKKTGIR